MKTIHTPEMVAHLWANKAQPRAQNPTHTLYFEVTQSIVMACISQLLAMCGARSS